MTDADDLCKRCDCIEGQLLVGSRRSGKWHWVLCPCLCHWTRAESAAHEADRRNKEREEEGP